MPLAMQYDHLEDGELVGYTQAGDAVAFAVLYNKYYPKIYRYIASMVGNDGSVDGLVQDTFSKAWQNILQLQGEKHFQAWLYRIATNVVRDDERGKQRRQWLPWKEPDQGGPDILVDGFEGTIEDQQLLHAALAQIPFHYRQCVMLSIVENYSQREIAQLLSISEKSVSTYVRRGLDKLRHICLVEGHEHRVSKKGR